MKLDAEFSFAVRLGMLHNSLWEMPVRGRTVTHNLKHRRRNQGGTRGTYHPPPPLHDSPSIDPYYGTRFFGGGWGKLGSLPNRGCYSHLHLSNWVNNNNVIINDIIIIHPIA